MAATYTFELTFTGLCIFTFGGDKRNPSEVNALLVDATAHGAGNGDGHAHDDRQDAHFPRLTFDTRNLQGFPKPAHELEPGSDGSHLGTIDLRARNISVRPHMEQLPPLQAVWRPDNVPTLPPEPPSPRAEAWLDWAMSLQRINSATPDPSLSMPFAGLLEEKFVGQVHLPCGRMEARRFLRKWNPDENQWRYVRWEFKEPSNGSHSSGAYAMAETVVLEIPGVPVNEETRIEGNNFDVRLVPARRADGTFEDRVTASITNLPKTAVPTHLLPPYLHHFSFFYDTVDFGASHPSLRFPYPPSPEGAFATITRDNSYCPPTSHTKAG